MKKLVPSAFALALTAGLGQASEDEWSQLDREVEALTSSLSLADGIGLSGWLRTNYNYSSDIDVFFDDGGGIDSNDLGGFDVSDARLIWDGSHGDYGFTIQYDFAETGDDALLDAFATFPIGGSITGTVGQFKAPVLHGAAMSARDTFFPYKTANSQAWTQRDQGVMLSGDFDTVGWYIAGQNGTDGQGDELFLAARVEVTLMGEGAGMVEGAYGGPDSPSGTIGAAYYDDGEASNSDGFTVDAYFASNTYSFSGEYVDIGNNTVSRGVGGYGNSSSSSAANAFSGAGALRDDSNPWSVAGTYMFTPDEWEGGVRYQDWDDANDTTVISVGVNRYIDGHDLKYGLHWTTTDNDGADVDLITVTLTVGF
ncbi:MAG: hypothetical protein E2O39_11745 [Planctomycetota bacterium]|nr:MAG: hypothetical protein E2O39_11745 [Planctomycetota bacterium]